MHGPPGGALLAFLAAAQHHGAMPRSIVPALVLCSLLPTGGCCSFARFFCGPDKTPWVSVEFDAPESAVRTFLEALRRDDPDVLYLSLSDGYRQRLGIDLMAVNVAWERFREQNPGLHVAGRFEHGPCGSTIQASGMDQSRPRIDMHHRRRSRRSARGIIIHRRSVTKH